MMTLAQRMPLDCGIPTCFCGLFLLILFPNLQLRVPNERLEVQQGDWWNFRQSHSDGHEYGDLDPRFLERPLRATDVVTLLAINPTTKAKELRHAAATKSLKRLKSALLGWTADEINAMDGKSALHMAAWKGSLENVEYLLDVGGCDINAYSQGEFTLCRHPKSKKGIASLAATY
jgi:hypothetical protein